MTRTRHGEDLRNPGFPPFRAHPLADAAAVLRRLLEVTKPEVVGDDVRCLSRILDALSAAEQQAFATTAQQVAELLDRCKLEEAALLAENTPQESGLQAVAADVRALPELVARPVVVPQLPVGDRERHPRRIG
jgi:hypothetical protein